MVQYIANENRIANDAAHAADSSLAEASRRGLQRTLQALLREKSLNLEHLICGAVTADWQAAHAWPGIEAGGEIAPQWDRVAGYAYMDGKIVASTEPTSAKTPFKDNTAALTPRHTANLWLKHKFGSGFCGAAGGRGESARYASPDDLTVLQGDSVIRAILDYLCLSYWVVFYRVHACLLGSYACKELVE